MFSFTIHRIIPGIFISYFLLFFAFRCEKDINTLEENKFRPEGIGSRLPFTTFLRGNDFFRSSNTRLVILKNKDDETEFLKTIDRNIWPFPTFFYQDSILVGIIIAIGLNSSDLFSIDSLISYSNGVLVYSHLFMPLNHWNDSVSPCHMVAIEKTDIPIYMNDIMLIFEE